MSISVQMALLLPPSVHFLYHAQNQATRIAFFKSNTKIMFIKNHTK